MIESIPDTFGMILKYFRKRQRLTQHQLAQVMGIHRNTLSRWEKGNFLPESKALVLELIRHLHLNESEARQLLNASLVAPLPLWSVPYPRNPFFTGREELLALLYAHLGSGQQALSSRSYALYGLGGIGKTQLALEYAYRYALEYRAVFWIEAETREQIHASFRRIATHLEVAKHTATDQQLLVAAVQCWLEAHGEWLLIWDNLNDLDLLPYYLPANRQGALLFTTQRQALGTLAELLELPPFSKEESTAFLLSRSRQRKAAVSQAGIPQQPRPGPATLIAANAVVHLLEGLPLALDQAGAYIEETGCSVADYLQRYHKHRLQALARRGGDTSAHPASVVATFQRAFEQVELCSTAAADLLRLCAFLHPEAIPEELFMVGAAHLGNGLGPKMKDPYQFDLTVAVLRHASLIARHAESRMFSVHPLVQAVLRDQMTSAQERLWSKCVVRVVNECFPWPVEENWEQCKRCLAQGQAAVLLWKEVGGDLPEGRELFSKVSTYL